MNWAKHSMHCLLPEGFSLGVRISPSVTQYFENTISVIKIINKVLFCLLFMVTTQLFQMLLLIQCLNRKGLC